MTATADTGSVEELTVDELAARTGMTVRTVRFYATEGLLPPPVRRGRIGYYNAGHRMRLDLIRTLQEHGYTLAAIERVARLSAVNVTPAPEGPAIQVSAGSDALVIPLEGLIDVNAEKERLTKALAVSEKEAASLAGRLSNANFVERAKPEAVEKARADHAHHAAEAERIKAALERLG